jgi:DNA-binding NarL/FixJ family response regulator
MSDETTCPKILIADDNGILRKGIAAIVQGIMPSASLTEVSTFNDAKQRLDQESFDAAIFDVDMRDLKAPSDFQALRATHPTLILAVISRDDDPEMILNYLAMGVNGYIHECSRPIEIDRAMHAVLTGMVYVPPTVVGSRSRISDYNPQLTPQTLLKLTHRQQGVLNLLINGLSNKEIARELKLSHNTVKIHVSALLRQFAVETRADLAAMASNKTNRLDPLRNFSPSSHYSTNQAT